jgi:hypothetical protein
VLPTKGFRCAAVIIPRYISEAKSDMRGIKHGWYAMDDEGNIVSGPFSNREKCIEIGIPPNKQFNVA